MSETIEQSNAGGDSLQPVGSAAAEDSMAMQRTWWVNVYPDGRITSALCRTREEALNRCTYTGETPDAEQVEVRLHIVRSCPPNDPDQRPGGERIKP